VIKICKKCLNPNTRPNIFFNEEGVCPVCQYENNKKSENINWDERERELDEIIEWGKANSNSSYDCIVTVSGGKDSTRQAFFARDELNLNPLLVSSVYPPEQLHDRGAYNLSNLISHGFDTLSISVDPLTYKRLMRYCFFEFVNIFTASEMALYAIPLHMAIAYKIPLIFLGENPAFTIGEECSGLGGDASQMRNSNTLAGGSADRLLIEGIKKSDIIFYDYPPEEEMKSAKLRLIYLGYYIYDWSGRNNAEFAIKRGLVKRVEPPEMIGDLWGFTGLDEDFRLVNQMIKFIKFGFGHVTDQVCETISQGTMTRDEGIKLVKMYDDKCDSSYIHKFCQFIDITENEFWETVESVRNNDIWEKDSKGKWKLLVDYS